MDMRQGLTEKVILVRRRGKDRVKRKEEEKEKIHVQVCSALLACEHRLMNDSGGQSFLDWRFL